MFRVLERVHICVLEHFDRSVSVWVSILCVCEFVYVWNNYPRIFSGAYALYMLVFYGGGCERHSVSSGGLNPKGSLGFHQLSNQAQAATYNNKRPKLCSGRQKVDLCPKVSNTTFSLLHSLSLSLLLYFFFFSLSLFFLSLSDSLSSWLCSYPHCILFLQSPLLSLKRFS